MSVDYEFVAPGEPDRVAYVLETVRSRVGLKGLRVLDLGCRVGAFGRAFADAGSVVTGIEGKAVNYDRIPEHPNATWLLGDVRGLNPADHGMFDVVLCLGLLYHLDANDAVGLLRSMRRVTAKDGFALVDTHAGNGSSVAEVDGIPLPGQDFAEPAEGTPWSSLGNLSSFWFTPESLADVALMAGWMTVETLPGVRYPHEPGGRIWRVLS